MSPRTCSEPPTCSPRSVCGSVGRFGRHLREVEGEGGACARRTRDCDRSSALPDEVAHVGQAEPATPPPGLRREVTFEDTRLVLFANTGSGILDLDQFVAARAAAEGCCSFSVERYARDT